MYEDKKGQSLDEYESEGKGKNVGFILLPFVTLSPPRKESNHSTDMSEGIRSLNYLVCIQKMGLLYNS